MKLSINKGGKLNRVTKCKALTKATEPKAFVISFFSDQSELTVTCREPKTEICNLADFVLGLICLQRYNRHNKLL